MSKLITQMHKKTDRLLPWPQTPESVRIWLQENGLCVAGIAKEYDISRFTLHGLLNGKIKGAYKEAHRGAVLLGLKPMPGERRVA